MLVIWLIIHVWGTTSVLETRRFDLDDDDITFDSTSLSVLTWYACCLIDNSCMRHNVLETRRFDLEDDDSSIIRP